MEKEFIPYKEALALKELGFDEPCLGYWNIDPYLSNPTFNLVKPFDHEWCIPAPLYQQAFRWFREKYGWVAEIHGSLQINHFYANLLLQAKGEVNNIKMCETYEEAELACLEKLIEIVKTK